MEDRNISFDEFCTYIKDNILEYMDAPEGSVAELKDIVKQNDESLRGIIITNGETGIRCQGGIDYGQKVMCRLGILTA